jgi:deoxyribodipyrimidine photo-lyase
MAGAPRYECSLVWLRRDLRLSDNHALYAAAEQSRNVVLTCVLDPILLGSERMGAPIVQCFFSALSALRETLRGRGSDLALLEGDFSRELVTFARHVNATAVFYNVDYEPDAIVRDRAVTDALGKAGIAVRAMVDHVYFGSGEVLQADGTPYRIFTPYKRRWLDRRSVSPLRPFPSKSAVEGRLLSASAIGRTCEMPAPETWGYQSSARFPRVDELTAHRQLDRFLRGAVDRYAKQRDFPAVAGTSRLSPQLRAGTIGVRTCVERAFKKLSDADESSRGGAAVWISQLIWRDFYQTVLARWPHVAREPFIEAANAIEWRRSENDFRAWCEGRTGIPIVDAGMRQLNVFGWMHNRLRMIVASFLSKDLLLDWRLGERYFEQHLADADLAQNNGGWQWAASTGTDAVPYFRIFSPVVQSRRFDPDGAFIRSMLPELANVPTEYIHAPWEMPPLVAEEARCRVGRDYPLPLVDHAIARERAIVAFAPLRARRRQP